MEEGKQVAVVVVVDVAQPERNEEVWERRHTEEESRMKVVAVVVAPVSVAVGMREVVQEGIDALIVGTCAERQERVERQKGGKIVAVYAQGIVGTWEVVGRREENGGEIAVVVGIDTVAAVLVAVVAVAVVVWDRCGPVVVVVARDARG